MKSPLAPQPVPLKLDSMPHSKGPFSANIHAIIPKLSVPIPHGTCFPQMVGGPPKMHGLGPKIHLKSPLAPQPVPLKLDSMPLLRAHCPRIYIRSFPNFLCLYLRACAFEIWWGAPSENARVGAQNPSEITLSIPAGTTETWFNATF